ncbi:metallopeptidase family protein [Nocardioides faecalis]|uniref:metallopeptidase family protein n=1 Tax=Nocardioides faecalis TaxID=2803858 RepID=UPI0020C07B68|nr:metallopeptidase family protein [Nocardioides faecalis]
MHREQSGPPTPEGRQRRRRDRRGRGARGPAVLPLGAPVPGDGWASQPRPPRPRTRREVFDRIMLDLVSDLDERWADRLGLLEYAVEDTPQLPEDWDSNRVPLSSLVRGTGTTPSRLVVFRRPLEHRASDRADLEAMLLTVVVEQVAELLGIPPSEVDPRYLDD